MTRFAKGAQPWHLEVHFVEPHDPYMPLKQYLDRYDPRSIPVPKSFTDTFAGKPGLHRRESETWGAVTEDDVRQSRAHYYAYTEQLDAQIGRDAEGARRDRAGRPHAGGLHDRSRRHGGRAPHVDQGLAAVRGVLSRADDRALAGADAGRLEDRRAWCRRTIWRTPTSPPRARGALPFADGAALQPLFADPQTHRVARRYPLRLLRRRVSCTRSASPSPTASSTSSTASITTRCTTWSAIPTRCAMW